MAKSVAVCVLVCALFSCIVREGQAQECVNGLMSAERVWQLGRVAGDLKRDRNKRQRIFPGVNFSCSGTVTQWTVAGRSENENKSPEVQIWRETSSGSGVYNKTHSMSLPRGSSSSNNIYNFTTQMYVQAGDILGVFEPDDTWLKYYYTDKYGPVTYDDDTGGSTTAPDGDFDIDAGGVNSNRRDMPLITVAFASTDSSSAADCTRNFASLDAIKAGLEQTVVEEEREQRLIPGINFTCHGFITKWILAAKWTDSSNYPELQTWNSTDGTTYMKQSNTTFSPEGGSAEMTYYEYSPDPPHEFNDGDVLGMFIPKMPKHKLFFEEVDSGPVNLVYDSDTVTPPGDTFPSDSITTVNAIPLIAVEVSIVEASSPAVGSSQVILSSTQTKTLKLTASQSNTVTPAPPSLEESGSSDDLAVVLAPVFVIVVVLLLAAVSVLVVVGVLVHRKRKSQYALSGKDHGTQSHNWQRFQPHTSTTKAVDNPVYGDVGDHDVATTGPEVYHTVDNIMYGTATEGQVHDDDVTSDAQPTDSEQYHTFDNILYGSVVDSCPQADKDHTTPEETGTYSYVDVTINQTSDGN